MRDGIPELKKVRVTSENKNAFKAPAGSEVREEVTIRRKRPYFGQEVCI